MHPILSIQAFVLAKYMSEISERCYCAGWMMGLEYTLWYAMLREAPFHYGQGQISERDLEALKWLSDMAGGWIVWDDTHGETFISLEEWKERFELAQLGNRNLSTQ